MTAQYFVWAVWFVIYMGPMIRTTHSCYLYGPYDSHNTQLLFIWAVWFAQHTVVILWVVWFAQHTHFSPTRHYPFCFCNQAKWLSPRPKYPSKYNLQLKNDNRNIYLVFKYNKLFNSLYSFFTSAHLCYTARCILCMCRYRAPSRNLYQSPYFLHQF